MLVVYCDGSVHFVAEDIDLIIWQALGTIAGGEMFTLVDLSAAVFSAEPQAISRARAASCTLPCPRATDGPAASLLPEQFTQ